VICGSGTKNLDWDPKNALPMKWNPGNIWKIDIENADSPVFVKILLREENGELKWMQGDNIEIKKGTALVLSSDHLRFC
jgi:hypothetical protein